MSTENEPSIPATRPVFRFLAGVFGVLSIILAGSVFVGFAFGSHVWWLRSTEAALFLYLGVAFIHAAFTGHWLRKELGFWLVVLNLAAALLGDFLK